MEKRAKSVEIAIEEALKELNATKEEVIIEVIDEGAKGFLGIGARDAVVNVALKKENKASDTKKAEVKPVSQKKSKKKDGGKPEDEAEKFLNDIFNAMKLEVSIKTSREGDNIDIELSGENMGLIIGKRGDTLDSLQYLTSLVVNQRSEEHMKVTIDTENYREKRSEALLALATRLSEKVEKTGRKFTLEAMNPYERRIIHAHLQDNPAVTTFSVGQEPYRKVVISPKNAKPYKKANRKPRPNDEYKRPNYKKNDKDTAAADKNAEELNSENNEGYATTYKADFKPQQHRAQYSSFEDYLAAQEAAKKEN